MRKMKLNIILMNINKNITMKVNMKINKYNNLKLTMKNKYNNKVNNKNKSKNKKLKYIIHITLNNRENILLFLIIHLNFQQLNLEHQIITEMNLRNKLFYKIYINTFHPFHYNNILLLLHNYILIQVNTIFILINKQNKLNLINQKQIHQKLNIQINN